MWDLLKEIFGHFQSLLLSIFVALLIIAIIGVIPRFSAEAPVISLSPTQRILVAFLAFATLPVGVWLERWWRNQPAQQPPENAEYSKRLDAAQQDIKQAETELLDVNQVLAEYNVDTRRFVIVHGDIARTGADILVSSDDNLLSVNGGVAKAILKKAGNEILEELERYRRYPRKLGDMVITTGGRTGSLAIFHPAMIEREELRLPDVSVVRGVVHRALLSAEALGAQRIAFPVVGGGTASQDNPNLSPWRSIQAIVSSVLDYFHSSDPLEARKITYVVLCIFDKNDIEGNLDALLP